MRPLGVWKRPLTDVAFVCVISICVIAFTAVCVFVLLRDMISKLPVDELVLWSDLAADHRDGDWCAMFTHDAEGSAAQIGASLRSLGIVDEVFTVRHTQISIRDATYLTGSGIPISFSSARTPPHNVWWPTVRLNAPPSLGGIYTLLNITTHQRDSYVYDSAYDMISGHSGPVLWVSVGLAGGSSSDGETHRPPDFLPFLTFDAVKGDVTEIRVRGESQCSCGYFCVRAGRAPSVDLYLLSRRGDILLKASRALDLSI